MACTIRDGRLMEKQRGGVGATPESGCPQQSLHRTWALRRRLRRGGLTLGDSQAQMWRYATSAHICGVKAEGAPGFQLVGWVRLVQR
jgi:hypothetical protein